MATPTNHVATRIQLCGEFAVEIEGRRVDAAIVGRQGRALLAYLVLHRGQRVRREELIEALWPGRSPVSPETALSTIISRLRRVVGHEMVCGRSELRLDLPVDALVDVHSAFEQIECAEQALERSEWEDATRFADAALAVAERGFIPELDASWAEEERRRLEEVRLRALECVAACGLALGGARLAATERAARRLIDGAPYRETGYRYLMDALAARGRVAEALRAFDEVRVLLQEELGVAPSAGLRMLHERLLIESGSTTMPEREDPLAVGESTMTAGAETAARRAPLPLPMALTRRERGQLFGRELDIGLLWGVYEDAKRGNCRMTLMRGEPGIGKTRLAVEFAHRVHQDRAIALYGRCDEEPLLPHQPFVEALGHYVAVCPPAQLAAQIGLGGGELRRLVPGLAERLPALPQPLDGDREGERYRLFEAVGALLRQAAKTTPVVLVLDDLHWADRSTLLLLRHLARQSRPGGLLVLGTYRDVALEPSHPLREMLADLSGDPGYERLSLGPLDVAAVEELVRAETGDQTAEFVRKLREETAGNPFFLGEMLRHLAEVGGLPETLEQQPSRLTDFGIPQSVKDVIGRRVGQLGQRTRAVLATGAVMGRAFEFGVLERLSGRDQDELLEALEEAVGARLIEEVPDSADRYTFTHALIRETLYGNLMRTRRALLHRRIAAAVEEIHGAEHDRRSAELAHHFSQAGAPGDIEKAIGYTARAGEFALAGLAYEQAAEHYRQALRLLSIAQPPADPARRCDLLIAQGSSERQAGDAAYRQTLLEAARLAQELGDAERLARAALANNRGFFSAAAGVDMERVSVLTAALEAQGSRDTATRASLLAQLAVELVPDADSTRRAQLSDDALAMARRVGDRSTLARTLNHRYVALWGPRTYTERLANAREASEIAERLEDPFLSFQSARFESHVAMEAGDLALADTRLKRARALADQLGQPIIDWYYAVTRAKRESISGSPAEAEKLVGDAYDLGERVGQPDAALWHSLGLFVMRLLQGTLAAGETTSRHAADGEAPKTDAGAPDSRSISLLMAAVSAATASECGRSADARAQFEVLMCAELRDLRDDWTALAVPAMAAVAATHLGDARRAGTLFALLEPYAGRFVDAGPAWFGAVSHHLACLATTLGHVDEANGYFADAARAYATLRADAWQIRVHLDWVRMLVARQREGDLDHARALLTDVRARAPRIGVPELQRAADELLGIPAFAG